jgi:hypothetical protein
MNGSLEGYMGHTWNGTYVLHLPNLLEGEHQSVSLNTVEIPRTNVLFWERIPS